MLINDILDLSRVEAGKLDVHPEPFALGSLAEDLRTVFEPLAAEEAAEFAVVSAPDVPAEVVTDRQRLRQVLHNLLSNAVKFTQQGRVELRLHRETPQVPGAEAGLAFSVSDTGIGISDDSLKTIFEAFQQGDGTTSRRYGGTGLGLRSAARSPPCSAADHRASVPVQAAAPSPLFRQQPLAGQ